VARWQVPLVLGAALAGTIAGLTSDIGAWSERLVVPSLIALLALAFAGIHPTAFVAQVRPYRRVAVTSLGLNFVWAPLAAGALGALFLAGSIDLRIGLVMLLVTPCTDWYLVFTATARGNVALGAALLPLNLVLQLALLPVFIVALTGAAADIPVGDLLVSVALVLGIPTGVALVARTAARQARASRQLDQLLERLEPASLAFLGIAIAAIFTAHAQLVVDQPDALLRLPIPLLTFFAATYLLATAIARASSFAHRERVTLTMTTMARNSPVALAIATAAFPDRPLIAVALVIGPLIELPVLSITAHALSRGSDQIVLDSESCRGRTR
jgi:arsenite transporter